MRKIISIFIILIMVLPAFSGCALLFDEFKLCEVNFYVDGELHQTKTANIGQTVSEPNAPKKENQIFVGWVTGGLISYEFDFSSKLIGDIDLHAYYVIDAVAMNDMITKQTIKSAVTIENKCYNTAFGTLMEMDFQTSWGSGVVIDVSDGYCYVLTNYHVAEKVDGFSKQTITVEDPWGKRYEAEVYKGLSKSDHAMSKEYDLALLCFRYSPTDDNALEEIGIGENPKTNEYIATIGTPNSLKNTVTYGQVVAYEPIKAGDNENLQNIKFDIIVHDAFIDHGSSGGALVNTNGDLVGINFAGYGNGEYGCAIPMDKILEFMKIYVY